MPNLERWKQRIRQLKTETYAIYLASKDPRVPWYAKAVILFTVIHTFSPIDLIPDFIPVIGYLDDLIITPLGIALALYLIPADVLSDCRARALATADDMPGGKAYAAVVVAIWLLAAAVALVFLWRAAHY